jgi:transposase InsO family protein
VPEGVFERRLLRPTV